MKLPLPASVLPTPPFPTMRDLPSDHPEDPGLPDEFHGIQPQMLNQTLQLRDYPPIERFTGFDMNLYYDLNHTAWYKRPDWFLVVGVNRLYGGSSPRSSYVVWDEGVVPMVVIEFLSPGTEAEDLGRFAPKPPIAQFGKPPGKFKVYEQILKIPNYIVFDEELAQLRFFRLTHGRYEEQSIAPTYPNLWIPELDIGLALWTGEYCHLTVPWMRWCDATGNLFPNLEESIRTQTAKLETQTAKLKAASTQLEATSTQLEATSTQLEEALVREAAAIAKTHQAILRMLNFGMPIETVAETFGLSVTEIMEIANR